MISRTLPASTFLDALTIHSRSVGGANTIQENIYIQITPDHIRTSTNNLETMTVYDVPVQGKGSAEALVDFKRFMAMVKLMTTVEIAIDEEKRLVVLNKGQVKLSGRNPDDYNTIPNRPEPVMFIENGKKFSASIKRCDFAMKRDASGLAGVSLSNVGNLLSICAADGALLAKDDTIQLTGDVSDFRMMINHTSVPSLYFFSSEPIGFIPADNLLFFTYPNGYMTVRLAEYRFPLDKIPNAIPTIEGATGIATVKVDDFKRAYQLVNETIRKPTELIRVQLSFNSNEMIVESGDVSENMARTIIPHQGSGEGVMRINQITAANIDYLMRYDRITFMFSGPNRSYVITSDQAPNYVTVLTQMVR